MNKKVRFAHGVMSQPMTILEQPTTLLQLDEPELDVPHKREPEIIQEHINIEIQEIKDFNKYSESIANVYMGNMTYYSTTLDVISVYLKGQKMLYIEAKTYCEMCLYLLMLPAIFISASCTVLSVSLKDYSFGNVLVSALTGANSFILGIVTYLKLDAKSEAHKITSYQFDKLQNICEFYSGKTLMIHDENLEENIKSFFETIEKKVSEIKDVNQFPIPEAIRYRYSKIYGFNVFSEMKKYKTDRNKNIQELILIDKMLNGEEQSRELNSLDSFDKNNLFDIYSASKLDLKKRKTFLINEIIEYRNFSKEINDIFEQEIDEYRNKYSLFNYFCLKS